MVVDSVCKLKERWFRCSRKDKFEDTKEFIRSQATNQRTDNAMA